MASQVRVIHYGLGPIGLEVVRAAARRPGIVAVGAVDIDPAKTGRDLAEIAELEQPTGVLVRSTLSEVGAAPGDVALHCTGSSLAQVRPQLEELLQAGLHVVSSCEELAYPVADRRGIGADLDRLAKSKGAAILGTGINPGFAMDALPIFLTTIAQEVRSITVKRVSDAGKRRLPLQKKVGAGLDEEAFNKLVAAGAVRHVGLQESVTMLADSMGWQLERVEEQTGAVIARSKVTTKYLTVEPGQVAGVRQFATGYVGGRAAIKLELQMYVGAMEEGDEVWLEGRPSLHFRCEEGFPGDVATAAIVVNSALRLPNLAPGLWTMNNLPPAHYRVS